MTDPSPDLLFGQHPKIACLSSSGQKRYIYIYTPDLPADPILEGSQRQVGQTSPNSIVWWVCVGMVVFKVSVGDFWTDAGPSAGPSFMTFLRWAVRVAVFTRRTLPRRTLISMI